MDWSVVAIVAIVIWGGVKAFQAKYGIVSDQDGNEMRVPTTDQAADGASKAEVAQLKERVQVLERLVTDRGFTLSDEIEALKDIPARNVPHGSASDAGTPLNVNRKTKA